MKVTFLGHSGFLAELPSVTLLFDWWKGALPPLREGVPLIVFASHQHRDHFTPRIFTLDGGQRETVFVLGHDIRLSPHNREKWAVGPETAEKCRTVRGGGSAELCGARVEALPSTDEGEAFLVSADGVSVFHAGDLNWWHWEGEDRAWNRNMEVSFQRYAEPLRSRRLDVAMLPLDPRLGEDGFRGPKYFLELAEIRRFLPMHQWGNFGFTGKFLEKYPAFASVTVPVERNGQTWTWED